MKKKILVTGGTGLVGKAIQKYSDFIETGYEYIFLSSKDCDLTDYKQTKLCFEKNQPNYIIHLAAIVGGLYKNMNSKVEMLEGNLMINQNVLKCAHEIKVEKVLSCLSTCIFPDKTSYPINEKMLHDGPPHDSNYCYAYAKRILEIQSRAYREQYGDNFITVIPTNIYGEHDNFNLKDAHVIPALIHKCYLSKKNNEDFVVFGTGKPLRQFIYSTDLARLMIWCLKNYNESESIIIAPDEKDEVSIRDIALMISKNFDYSHRIKFDSSKSDGQYKKTADNSKLKYLYGEFNADLKLIQIENGISNSVKWFINNYEIARK